MLPLAGLLVVMLLRPAEAFAAAGSGFALWYRVVLPSLLPFFIISELLLQLGAAQAAGRLLAPLMRPLFYLPGSASFAVARGFSAGFPTGAAVTAGLYRSGEVDREQAGRLLAFTNNAGPLYITVAVAAGLFAQPAAAPLLAGVHYGLNLLLGILLGLFARRQNRNQAASRSDAAKMAAGFTAQRRGDDPQQAALPFANMLKAAAQRAAANIALIGCYMVFFSVLSAMLAPATLSEERPLLFAALNGLWEMSNGMQALAVCGLPLTAALPLAAAQLAFGGFSVQAQVLAMIADTEISPRWYLLSRPLHALASALLLAWLLPHTPAAAPVAAGTVMAISLPPAVLLAPAAFASLLWLAACAVAYLLWRGRG